MLRASNQISDAEKLESGWSAAQGLWLGGNQRVVIHGTTAVDGAEASSARYNSSSGSVPWLTTT